MAGRRRTKTEPAGASANNSLTEDDPEIVTENNKDESEKNGAGKASTSSTTGTAWSGFREHPPCRHPRSLNPDWPLNTCQLFVNFDQFSMELSSQSGFRDQQS